ncbi:HTH-type, LysR family transcriptional regulator [Shouchella lehensis G1]|uniref:HTH-type, LysR family transcriptional regulator n=1 Tax=Shouchella lehensis G1 TaxID=1246626 RepID=A0A060LQD2_9BACI|nr:HTH-type, LysR family transcriptional regulator [Shouchella lehensis G1]
MLDQKDWHLIHELYKNKNITKTAEKLFVSQPSISYRLKRIEQDLGVSLFFKTKKGIGFTSEGDYLAQQARDMIQSYQQMKDQLLNMQNEVSGTLRIGASSNYAQYLLPQMLKAFSDQYENVRFQVRTGWSTQILDLLQNDVVHVGILRSDFSWPGIKLLLKEEQLALISKTKLKIESLPMQPYLSYRTDTSLTESIKSWWNDRFEDPPYTEMDLDRFETCKEMVKQGLGYSIAPMISLSEKDQLYIKPLHFKNKKPVIRRTWLLASEEASRLAVVERFIQFIQTMGLDHK